MLWLEPYPDVLLDGLPDTAPGPEARYESAEAISLAFITAVQLLPPRQRAALVLRDVLGFPAAEVADMLATTEQAVTSALKRARSATAARPGRPAHVRAGSTVEAELVAQLTRALECGDVDGLVALLTRDVVVSMPPMPFEYVGREPAAQFLRTVVFRPGAAYRLVPTRANGQPAVGVYQDEPHADVAHANGLLVLTLSGNEISAVTRFDASVLAGFGLPRTLPSQSRG